MVDGDSFDLTAGRRIRLLGIDAPDKGRCLYEEARERLKELVLGKRVNLTDIVIDDYGRILANVWASKIGSPSGFSLRSGGGLNLIDLISLQKAYAANYSLPLRHPFINKILLEEGLAKFIYVSSPYYEELKQAASVARSQKLGIYSPVCLNIDPKNDCVIKGNTNSKDEKVYHLPDCPNYKQVIVDEAFGDSWFCHEEEATKAGFRKASGC